MPEVTEKAMIYLGMATAARDAGKPELEKDFLNAAETTSQKLDSDRTPFLLLAIAGRSNELKLPYGQAIFSDVVKRLNRIDKPLEPILQHPIGTPPAQYRFPISVKNVGIGFSSSFASLIAREDDNALTMANDISDEGLKAKAFIAVAKAILSRKVEPPKKP